ncbi:MAG: hypothetical protein ABSG14_05080 [Verrucomicrobiia bacterium]|jgi:hypothetical protein
MRLFVREGAVIPMVSTNVQTLLDTSYTGNPNLVIPGNALQFLIYPTTNSSFTVYDGTSLGWYYDSSGFLNVGFNHTGGTAQITFGPDSISDGISDSWGRTISGRRRPRTRLHATCDADGDGFDNLQEYLTGTDPLNPADFFRVNSLVSSGGNVTVNFSSVLGMNYEVDYTPDLMNAPWQILTNGIMGTGEILPINDPGAIGQTQRFYRVKLLPQSE